MIQNLRLRYLRFMYIFSQLTSQAGQDFWVYGEVFNEKKFGYFIDIGAHDGVRLSNTFLLESRYKWNGICIEANPNTYKKLVRNRDSTCLNICLDRSEGEVDFVLRGLLGGIVDSELCNTELTSKTRIIIKLKTSTLNQVLENQNAPNVIDYLSIDVEGAEERVLSQFNFEKYTFRCITIERPSDKLKKLLSENNYILIKEIPGLDSFYLHRSFEKEYLNNLITFYKKKYFRFRWK